MILELAKDQRFEHAEKLRKHIVAVLRTHISELVRVDDHQRIEELRLSQLPQRTDQEIHIPRDILLAKLVVRRKGHDDPYSPLDSVDPQAIQIFLGGLDQDQARAP